MALPFAPATRDMRGARRRVLPPMRHLLAIQGLSPPAITALLDLADGLKSIPDNADAEALQNLLYDVGKRHPFASLREWFGCLYQVLLGQTEGPRFGGFIALYGIAPTIALIEQGLAR